VIKPDKLSPTNLLPLDAAPASLIDETMQIRSRARLEQILALPTTNPAAAGAPIAALRRRTSPRVRALRWAAIPVAAAGALAASVMLPGSPTLPPAQASLASWRAVPSALDDHDAGPVAAACIAAVDEMVADESQTLSARPTLGDPIIRETRGDWVTVVYAAGNAGFTSCLIWLDPAQGPVAVNAYSQPAVEDDATGLGVFVNWEIGAGSSLSHAPGPGRFDIAPDAIRLAIATEQILVDGGVYSTVIGRVGSDVEQMVLHTYTGGDVVASVSDGWYSAWWPGAWGGATTCAWSKWEDGTTNEWGCNIASTVTVTLRDGSTKEVRFDSSGNEAQDQYAVWEEYAKDHPIWGN